MSQQPEVRVDEVGVTVAFLGDVVPTTAPPPESDEVRVWDGAQGELSGVYTWENGAPVPATAYVWPIGGGEPITGHEAVFTFEYVTAALVMVDAAASTGYQPMTYEWDFGDGATATGVRAKHEYTRYGEFTITLTLTGADNRVDVAAAQIIAFQDPVAHFTYTQTNRDVMVDASASSGGGSELKYFWNGVEGLYRATIKLEGFGGTTDISLQVENEQGRRSAVFERTVPVPTSPIAKLRFRPPTLGYGMTWTIGSDAEAAPNRTLLYSWDYGDGNFRHDRPFNEYSHTYESPGVYTITHWVTDSSGETDTVTAEITVQAGAASVPPVPWYLVFLDAVNATGSSTNYWGDTEVVQWFNSGGASRLRDPAVRMGNTRLARRDGATPTGMPAVGNGGGDSGWLEWDHQFLQDAGHMFVVMGDQQSNTSVLHDFGYGVSGSTDWLYYEPGTSTQFRVSDHFGRTGSGWTGTVVDPEVRRGDWYVGDTWASETQRGFAVNGTQLYDELDPGPARPLSWNPRPRMFRTEGNLYPQNYTARCAAILIYPRVLSEAEADEVRTWMIQRYIDPASDPLVAGMAVGVSDLTVSVDGSPTTGGVRPSYVWDFGDGTAAEGETAEHTYADEGEYTVTLSVADAQDRSDTTSDRVAVGGPTALFSVTADLMTVQLDASASFGGTAPLLYRWDFGNGAWTAPSPEPIRAYLYQVAGDYTITLTVIDAKGLEGTFAKDVSVTPHPPPVAAYTYSADGFTVSFDGSSSTGDAVPLEYRWTFGDGQDTDYTTDPATEHTYAGAGTYRTGLNVRDAVGRVDKDSQDLELVAAPPGNLPPVTDGLAIFLDAASAVVDGGGTVTAWPDDSGRGDDPVLRVDDGTGLRSDAATPTGRPAVYDPFARSGSMKQGTVVNWDHRISTEAGHLFFVVGDQNRDQSVFHCIGTGDDSYWLNFAGGQYPVVDNFGSSSRQLCDDSVDLGVGNGDWWVGETWASADQRGFAVNDVQAYSGGPVPMGWHENPSFFESKSWAPGFKGHCAAIVWYDRVLAPAEADQVRAWLTERFVTG